MDSTTTQRIADIHALYARLTGLVLPLNTWRERAWFEFLRAGNGPAQLEAVVNHVRRGMREQRGYSLGTLKFSRLIEQLDRFEELLAEARAEERARRARARENTPRAEVLRATGRPAADPAPTTRQAGAVAQQLTRDPDAAAKALAELQRLKASL